MPTDWVHLHLLMALLRHHFFASPWLCTCNVQYSVIHFTISSNVKALCNSCLHSLAPVFPKALHAGFVCLFSLLIGWVDFGILGQNYREKKGKLHMLLGLI